MTIGNINTTTDNRADYKYSVWNAEDKHFFDGEIKGHQRENGFWSLIYKILDKLKREGDI
jgi:hypothetical protein